jgi:hypothetical protein
MHVHVYGCRLSPSTFYVFTPRLHVWTGAHLTARLHVWIVPLFRQPEALLHQVTALTKAVAAYDGPITPDLAKSMASLGRDLLVLAETPLKSGGGEGEGEAPAAFSGTIPKKSPLPSGGAAASPKTFGGGDKVMVTGGGPEASVLDDEEAQGRGGGEASPKPKMVTLDWSKRNLGPVELERLLAGIDPTNLKSLDLSGKPARELSHPTWGRWSPACFWPAPLMSPSFS